MINVGKWTTSTSDEVFNENEYFDTKEEAIAWAKAEYAEYSGVTKFYVGQVADVGLGVCVDMDNIFEHINQNMSDEVGEVAEEYLFHVEKEHEQELERELCEVIAKWILKHGYEPAFFQIINSETVEM